MNKNIWLKSIVLCNLFFASAILCSCGNESDHAEQKGKALADYQAAPTPETAIKRAKLLLDLAGTDTTIALAEYAEIVALLQKHGGTELIGIQGAYCAKIGGIYEPYDVVKAVERVEDGLAILQTGLREYPGDKNLQLYYAVTLSSLPSVFKKESESKKLLLALLQDPRLSEREQNVVKESLARLP